MRYQETPYQKFNLGAGYGWAKEGWEVLDHDLVVKPFQIRKQAWDLPYRDESFQTVFCSHVFEHISHFKIEQVICEINRVMDKDGILRLLVPDLKKIATAYVNSDRKAMAQYIKEDGSGMKSNLGLGQAFMNFVVSAGGDNFMMNSDFSEIIAGYAHVYCYDYEMLSGLLGYYGFYKIRQCSIDDSEIQEHKELRMVPHDKEAGYSLVVECRKEKFISFSCDRALLHTGPYQVADIIPKPYSPLWVAFKGVGHGYNTGKYFISKMPASVKSRLKGLRRYLSN